VGCGPRGCLSVCSSPAARVAGRYLRWVVGLVDSDTLPLSVSRETLQQHGSLKTIAKKLVRKALDMIRKIADAEKEAEEEAEDGSGGRRRR
jgi:heat shock protein 90kDa beta